MPHFSEGPWTPLGAAPGEGAPGTGIWTLRMQPASVNATLVAGSDRTLLVDTGSAPAQGRRLAASAARLTGRPVSDVLVTHWHFDHFFGLPGVQREVPGVRSWGHPSLLAQLAADADEVRADLGFDLAELRAPGTPVSDEAVLDLGTWDGRARTVQVMALGPAHTDGDLVALVPDARVALVGDLVEQGDDPQAGDDATPQLWPGALDRLLARTGDDWTFVPGHGTPVDAGFVRRQRDWLAARS